MKGRVPSHRLPESHGLSLKQNRLFELVKHPYVSGVFPLFWPVFNIPEVTGQCGALPAKAALCVLEGRLNQVLTYFFFHQKSPGGPGQHTAVLTRRHCMLSHTAGQDKPFEVCLWAGSSF